MNKKLILSTLIISGILFSGPGALAQQPVMKKDTAVVTNAVALKDTVTAGIYITSIHDIDFKQKEFTISFWLWLIYRNADLDFYKYIEVPQAKSVEKSFFTTNTRTDGKIYMLMKLQCVMKDSWKIVNFPFDQQKLRLSIENSQWDSSKFVFKPDMAGKQFDPRFVLRGWNIDSCILSAGIKPYETAFGDESFSKPHSEYSAFRVRLSISRSASGLFWKMFLGMYIGFLIAFCCFFVHATGMDSRFALCIGSVFAVIGNKYIIESSLPESTSFTLVDLLHGITLIFILTIVALNAYSLRLVNKNKQEKASKFDSKCAVILFSLYFLINTWFIWRAVNSG